MKQKPISVSQKMAEASIARDQFICPVCLDLLKDPVTIPCGHSYCMSCIKSCWDQEDQVGVYSCPQCRQTFIPRPVLGRNTILVEVVENLKKTGLQASTSADHHTGPGDVECDVCTGRKHKAIKSCLACLASYCQTHLQPHFQSPAFKKHKLIDATGHLQEKICSHHDEPLKIYCRTDQQCICYLCMMDEHRGHDTVSAATGRTEKQNETVATKKQVQQRLQERETELQELREAVDSLTSSAQAAVEDSKRIFIEMIRSIERRRSEVTELIRDQEKTAVSQAEGVMKRLEQEIEDLKRRNSELEQLSHTEDHIHFLQRCQPLCVPLKSGESPISQISPHCDFGALKNAVSDLKNKIIQLLQEELKMPDIGSVHILEPKTREEFLQHSCQLTLDPNTAHRHLHLSEGNRVVTLKSEPQSCPDHKDRFDWHEQVLCRKGLTGRCYWEVEWSGRSVDIAVTYKEIIRKGWGDDSCFGFNDKSWSLYCSSSRYNFYHNNEITEVSGPPSSRIGVYLDHRAGTLSFYSISDTMTLLHRVQTTFTQPLYPGFYVYGAKVKMC